METAEQFRKEYPEVITLAQSEKIDSIEEKHGIRSIWYGRIEGMIFICTENTGMIIGILPDGSSHS